MAETHANLLNIQEVKKMEAGNAFKGIFVVKNLTRKSDKNGRHYWEITVSDSTGQLDAKVWSDAGWLDRSDPEQEPRVIPVEEIHALKGKTIGAAGKVSDYRGQSQWSFSALSLLNQEKYSPARYIPSSPLPLEQLERHYEMLIGSCTPRMGDFIRYVYSGDRWQNFRDWPAAVSHHHAYAHGLLEHTLSVAALAKSMAENYGAAGVCVDLDVVIAGALLHDLGKIQSYRMSPVPDVTLEGAIHDHVAIGYACFIQLAGEFSLSEEWKNHLGHIILSHHGQKEFGSPVLPATPEAIIVSYADGLDFHLYCWQDAVKDMLEGQQISLFHYGAQRRFWKREEPEES